MQEGRRSGTPALARRLAFHSVCEPRLSESRAPNGPASRSASIIAAMVAPCGRFSSASTASCFDLARALCAIGFVRFTFDRVFVAERGFALLGALRAMSWLLSGCAPWKGGAFLWVQVHPATAPAKLKATFPNREYRLWPGQFVTARPARSGWLAPEPRCRCAGRRGRGGRYVFLIGDDDKVAVQRVNVGPIEDGMALIDSGLQAGQRVVLDGQSRLRAGVQVGAAASTDVSQD
jgi:hypothetical protein